MSIEATLSSDGLEEVYTAPTLKEMCLYKCLTNKQILTKEMEVDGKDSNGSEKLDWEKFRVKGPVQRELVEALLDAGEKHLFMLTPNYQPVLAAIRMSQSEHLVKVHVNNTDSLDDRQLKFLISGGNVKSLDINGCYSLRSGSLDAINTFGSELEYLRMGDSPLLQDLESDDENSAILRTPKLKTFIITLRREPMFHSNLTKYFKFLVLDFISNLEDLQITGFDGFETLDFLESATSKLTSLSMRDCRVAVTENAWASLFKLDKLTSLEVVRSSIGEAFVGENVVQRLLTAMPKLTHLAVDSGLIKDISADTSIRGQGSMAKPLKFLGIMEKDVDETELRTAKLFANEVAYFGTVDGELLLMKYFSNHLNAGYLDYTLVRLLKGLSEVAPWKTVAVISLLMKIIKNNGVDAACPFQFFEKLKKLLTPNIWTKLGEVLQDQCIAAILACLSRFFIRETSFEAFGFTLISEVMDIMMNLGGELRFDHYLTAVPMVMSIAERVLMDPDHIDTIVIDLMELFKNSLRKVAQVLENAVDRFSGETNALWGISSFLVVIKQLKVVIVSAKLDRYHLIETFSSLITSLTKLCLSSGPRRAAFHSADGVKIVMEWLTEIIDGCLALGDRDCFGLLVGILKSILEDTKLRLSDSGSEMIASCLEKLLFSLHSKWQFWKSTPVLYTMYYNQFQNIGRLLRILENDPRYDYETSYDVDEIMEKLK